MHADAILAIATIIILVAMSLAATISIMVVASRLRHLRHLEKLEKMARIAEEWAWVRRFTS
jgi:hypothetical protein